MGVCVCVYTAAAAAAATTITRKDAHVFCGASVYAFEHSQKVNVWIPLMMGSQCVCVKFLRKKRPNAHTLTQALSFCVSRTHKHTRTRTYRFSELLPYFLHSFWNSVFKLPFVRSSRISVIGVSAVVSLCIQKHKSKVFQKKIKFSTYIDTSVGSN